MHYFLIPFVNYYLHIAIQIIRKNNWQRFVYAYKFSLKKLHCYMNLLLCVNTERNDLHLELRSSHDHEHRFV